MDREPNAVNIPVGMLVRAVKDFRKRWKGTWIVHSVDKYSVELRSSNGRCLYFGPKTFYSFWELALAPSLEGNNLNASAKVGDDV